MIDYLKVCFVVLSGFVFSDLIEPVSIFLKMLTLIITIMYGVLKYFNELYKYKQNKKDNDTGNGISR